MTKEELVRRLSEYPDDMQVMILDNFNGAGFPREINTGPYQRTISEIEVKECADCEDLGLGTNIVVLGFGNY